MKNLKYLTVIFLFAWCVSSYAQNELQLVTSQLGFMPQSPKTVTLVVPKGYKTMLPDQIPFYITPVGYRVFWDVPFSYTISTIEYLKTNRNYP
jgi:hypothetical protein